jgi:hypothetical protein
VKLNLGYPNPALLDHPGRFEMKNGMMDDGAPADLQSPLERCEVGCFEILISRSCCSNIMYRAGCMYP